MIAVQQITPSIFVIGGITDLIKLKWKGVVKTVVIRNILKLYTLIISLEKTSTLY